MKYPQWGVQSNPAAKESSAWKTFPFGSSTFHNTLHVFCQESCQLYWIDSPVSGPQHVAWSDLEVRQKAMPGFYGYSEAGLGHPAAQEALWSVFRILHVPITPLRSNQFSRKKLKVYITLTDDQITMTTKMSIKTFNNSWPLWQFMSF